jgi:hypothetical protein
MNLADVPWEHPEDVVILKLEGKPPRCHQCAHYIPARFNAPPLPVTPDPWCHKHKDTPEGHGSGVFRRYCPKFKRKEDA